MSDHMSVYSSLDRMDHAPSKSTVRRWLDKITGVGMAGSQAHAHARMGALALRSGLEAAFVGGALGALDAELTNGLDFHKVPIDGAIGVGGLIVGTFFPNEDFSQDAIHVGAASVAVFGFRQSKKFLTTKKATAVVAGEFGHEDPIIAASRKL